MSRPEIRRGGSSATTTINAHEAGLIESPTAAEHRARWESRPVVVSVPVGATSVLKAVPDLAADRTTEQTTASGPSQPNPWYGFARTGVDVVAAVLGVTVAQAVQPGAGPGVTSFHYLGTVVFPTVWVALVALSGGWGERGTGPQLQAPISAFGKVVVLVALASYAVDVDVTRKYLTIALPATLVLDVGARVALRSRSRRRAEHAPLRPVLAVGDVEGITAFAHAVRGDRAMGMSVCGACLIDHSAAEAAQLTQSGVPVIGDIGGLVSSARAVGASAVAVVSASRLGGERLRGIAWQLEGTGIDLLVSPGLVEVASRRLRIHSVAWMPLLRVEQPRFRGIQRVLKDIADRVLAAVAGVLLLPLLAVIFVVVRASSPGPALFRQTRVGREGRTFQMLKFRSMSVDAESRITELSETNVYSTGPLFKVRDDPRVTPVGRILRRYSLDELPQLANVLAGHMSLVGPRPPLPSEVSQYQPDVRRRLLVKPGITGLWQVSGRSDLSWEESLRLDLRYVENWSPGLDLKILWKTASAVLRQSGAY